MLKRQICERKLCNAGVMKEHISERIGNLAVSLAGNLARKVFEACQHIDFFVKRESIVAFSVCASDTVAQSLKTHVDTKSTKIHHAHTIFGVEEIYWNLNCMCSLGLWRGYHQLHVRRDLVFLLSHSQRSKFELVPSQQKAL